MAQNSDLQLSIGYWIVSHKQTLKTWWAISLMVVIWFSLIWMLVFFGVFFSQESKVNALLVHEANGPGSFRTAVFQPQGLTSGTVIVITRDQTHVDVVAELSNPNQDWGGQVVAVHFFVDGASTTPQKVFINQASHRPIIQRNVTVKNSAAVSASLVVDDTTWARASAAGLPAAKFLVSAPVTDPSTVTINGQTRTSVSIHADVANQSVYNFYHVDVPILLLSGDRIVGVEQIGVDRWPTLTTKTISATLSYAVPDITSYRIEPQVSRFDTGNTYR